MTWTGAPFRRRYSRRVLPNRSAVDAAWQFEANGLRTYRALTSRHAFADVAAIGRTLGRDGIVVASSDTFVAEEGRRAVEDAAARVLEASRSEGVGGIVAGTVSAGERQKEYLVHLLPTAGVRRDDPILKVALDRKLLEIVAPYLGLSPCLDAVGAWLNYPTGAPPELSQLWHPDSEDLGIIKAFIFLADVDDGCGPCTYIPGRHPSGPASARAPLLERKKRIGDERLARVFRPESWKGAGRRGSTGGTRPRRRRALGSARRRISSR